MRDRQDLTLEQLLTAFAEAWSRHDAFFGWIEPSSLTSVLIV